MARLKKKSSQTFWKINLINYDLNEKKYHFCLNCLTFYIHDVDMNAL